MTTPEANLCEHDCPDGDCQYECWRFKPESSLYERLVPEDKRTGVLIDNPIGVPPVGGLKRVAGNTAFVPTPLDHPIVTGCTHAGPCTDRCEPRTEQQLVECPDCGCSDGHRMQCPHLAPEIRELTKHISGMDDATIDRLGGTDLPCNHCDQARAAGQPCTNCPACPENAVMPHATQHDDVTQHDEAFVTREEIGAFEARVMSVGHGVLSDSEWRRLIDTLEAAQSVIDVVSVAAFDHECGLEGYDNGCPECRAVKALHEYEETKR